MCIRDRTTCGTGSEVTTSAVVLDRARKRKVSLRQGNLLCARLAIVDPLLMTKLPPKLVATTGIDALTHAVESYMSLVASPMTEGCALYAMELIGRHLRPAAANPANYTHLRAHETVLDLVCRLLLE